MKLHVAAGDIESAIGQFWSLSADRYRQEFLSIGLSELKPLISEIPAITPVLIENNRAQYRFERAVQGFLITFPVHFVKQNGIWRILEF